MKILRHHLHPVPIPALADEPEVGVGESSQLRALVDPAGSTVRLASTILHSLDRNAKLLGDILHILPAVQSLSKVEQILADGDGSVANQQAVQDLALCLVEHWYLRVN